jgi:DNA polymerase-1
MQDLTLVLFLLLESAAELKVPLIVDTGAGNNWEEAH